MVTCKECGKEIEVREDNGRFIAGCWSASHEAPTVDGLELMDDDIWPICGIPKKTRHDALESFFELWVC